MNSSFLFNHLFKESLEQMINKILVNKVISKDLIACYCIANVLMPFGSFVIFLRVDEYQFCFALRDFTRRADDEALLFFFLIGERVTGRV